MRTSRLGLGLVLVSAFTVGCEGDGSKSSGFPVDGGPDAAEGGGGAGSGGGGSGGGGSAGMSGNAGMSGAAGMSGYAGASGSGGGGTGGIGGGGTGGIGGGGTGGIGGGTGGIGGGGTSGTGGGGTSGTGGGGTSGTGGGGTSGTGGGGTSGTGGGGTGGGGTGGAGGLPNCGPLGFTACMQCCEDGVVDSYGYPVLANAVCYSSTCSGACSTTLCASTPAEPDVACARCIQTLGALALDQQCNYGSGYEEYCLARQCVDSCTCAPTTTCSSTGTTCGGLTNDCLEVQDCGACTGTDTCGGGTAANTCGCTPTTCAEVGANCGSVPDGCGGTLTCGTCTGQATCGGAGVPNVCGVADCSTEGWCIVHPNPHGFSLNAVHAVSADDMWAVGDYGVILRAGASGVWVPVASGVTEHLRGIWGSAANNLIAVGDGGTILRWNGTAWSPMTSNTTDDLYDVWGSGASDVWAVGNGTISRWNGTAWSEQIDAVSYHGVHGTAANNIFFVGPGGSIARWNGSSFAPETTGTTNDFHDVWTTGTTIYAASENGVYRKTGSGSWSQQSGTSGRYRSIAGASATSVTAVIGCDPASIYGCSGAVWSFDGTTWASALPVAFGLNGVATLPSGDLWAVGQQGITVGQRGGRSTSNADFALTTGFDSVWASGPNDIWIVDDYYYSNNTVGHFNGIAWEAVRLPAGFSPRRVFGFGRDDVWISGSQTASPSSVGVMRWDGATWTYSAASTNSSSTLPIWGTSPQDVWVGPHHWDGTSWSNFSGGSYYFGSQTEIWGSAPNDVYFLAGGTGIFRFDGTTVTQLQPEGPVEGGSGLDFTALAGTGPSDVWVAGADYSNGCHVYRFDGTSWAAVPAPAPCTAVRLFSNGAEVIAQVDVTYNDVRLQRWDSGSSSWLPVASFLPDELNGVYPLGAGSAVGVGENGLVASWDGTSWRPLPLYAWSDSVSDIWGSSANDAWAVSSSGVFHYDGTRWSPAAPSNVYGGYGVWGSGANDVWVVGSGNGAWRRQDSVWTEYTLPGNYPTYYAVWGSGASNVWAGSSFTYEYNSGTSTYDYFAQLAQYNGLQWVDRRITVTGSPSGTIKGIWGTGPSNVWVVGDQVILRYDGTAWSQPAIGGVTDNYYTELERVWGTGPNDVWITGRSYDNANYEYVGLLIHYTGGTNYTLYTAPSPVERIYDAWGPAANNVWFPANDGYLYRWNGTDVVAADPPSGVDLLSIWGTSATNAWMMGSSGVILQKK